jgi:defect-in-organelle-trafficking protein DotD
MTKCLSVFALSLLLLTGCAKKTTLKKPPQNAPADDASIKLAEAANSVSTSLLELARIEKVTKKDTGQKKLVNVMSYNLEARASVDWSGPVEELVERLAKASFYKIRVLGRQPAIPVLVSVTASDKTLVSILRNIDYQIGNKADIRVYPRRKMIELRYAKA